MVISTVSYLSEKGVLSRACKYKMRNSELIKIYRTMWLARHIDERMLILQRQGTISFSMSSRGEEACSVASAAALQIQDWIYPQYRESGAIFWRGFTPLQYVHQMFGDAEDLTHGRQMPNHFGSRELNVVTVSSPIGTKIPHAAGCAYAMKLQKEKSVALCYFGEGASSEGDFHAGVNFAAVRSAPVIFFCRNNGYAISTPASKQFASEGVAPKGVGYGIKTVRIDGNDVFAIHEAVTHAREHCLQGKGPVLIESMTYRLGAHSTSDDPSRYRENAEMAEWEKKCPLLRLRLYLEAKKLWSKNKEETLLQEIKQQVDEAIAVAKKTPKPCLESLFQDVYFEIPESLKQQYEELKAICQK